MELATPAARFFGPADRELLAGMRCSSGAWFEDDVEVFIRTRLADYHDWRAPHTDHTIIGLEPACDQKPEEQRHEGECSGFAGEARQPAADPAAGPDAPTPKAAAAAGSRHVDGAAFSSDR